MQIIAILDNTGNVVVEYKYDAWGNHAVLDSAGNDVTSGIGVLNPFRYRGYYYDTETELYYLQTRYYDPETGRFISQDSIDYADPESINGLNLYAYCGNNPVMNVDPNGHFLLSFLIAIAAGAIIGSVAGGVSAVAKGENFWGGFLSGALVGGVLGGALFLGGATMLAIAGKASIGITISSFAAKTALLVGTATASSIVSMGAGMGAYAIRESMNGRAININEMFREGMNTGAKGILAFFTGMVLSTAGVYDYLIKGVQLTFKEKFATMLTRSVSSFILQFPWKKLLS